MALKSDGERARFSTTLKKDNKVKLNEIAQETGLNISVIVDMAIENLYNKMETDGINFKL